VSIWRRQSSGVVSTKRLRSASPALLMRIFNPLKSFTMAPTIACTAAKSATSA
jgi:hypothetical protein